MKKEINTLNAVISKDEEILWHGKVSQKGLLILKSKILGLLGFWILTFIAIIFCRLKFFDKYKDGYFMLMILPIIVSFVFTLPIYSRTIFFGELRNLEYYITNKQEFDVKGEKISFQPIYYDVYQRLKLDDLERIEIIPLRFFSLAHIDFYSNFIDEYPYDFYFGIKKLEDKVIIIINGKTEQFNGKKEKIFEKIKPELSWKNTQTLKGSKHRFYYIEDYKNVEEILKKIFPNKVKIVE